MYVPSTHVAIPTFFVSDQYLAEKLVAEFYIDDVRDTLSNPLTTNYLDTYRETREILRKNPASNPTFYRFLKSTYHDVDEILIQEQMLSAFIVALHYYFGY